MTDLIIFGAGKLAEVVSRFAQVSGTFTVRAFTCDREFVPAGGSFCGLPVVAFDDVVGCFPPDRFAMIVAIGYHHLNALRRAKYDIARSLGYRLASVISPTARFGDWLEAGDNCIILDNVTLEPGTQLGNNVVLWTGALVGHHTIIEDHCWIAGHAVFGGGARLGSGSFVGLAAVIGNEVAIGEQSFIGAGALVTACAGPKSVFVAPATPKFRLDSDAFMKISKIR